MARDLEQITKDFWRVSHALHHPQGPPLGCGDALRILNSSDRLRPDEWRLAALVHTIRYDIIEGNSRWRQNEKDSKIKYGKILRLSAGSGKVT